MTGTIPHPRVAVIGCGDWDRNLIRNFAALGALAAVADPKIEVAEALAREHGGLALDPDAALRDPGIDAVALASPSDLHGAMAAIALDAGKHVYVEKPLARSLAEAEAVLARAETRGRVLMVGHILQYHPAFLALKALVDAGGLGRLLHIRASRFNLGKVRRNDSAWWDLAPHDMSMVLALAGAMPERVQAASASHMGEAPDFMTAQLSFSDGMTAEIAVTWLNPFKEHRLSVVGSDAMAVFDDTRPRAEKLAVYRHRVPMQEDGDSVVERAEPDFVALAPDEPLREECAHFLDCIRTGTRPRTDGAEAVRVTRVLEAADRAAREARSVSIEPARVRVD